MRPIYGCPEKFWESSLCTRLLFQKFVMDFCSNRYNFFTVRTRNLWRIKEILLWLKSVYIYGSYRKIKTGYHFLDHSVRVLCDKAAGQGHLKVIRFLLSNGADTSLVDNANDTARDVAVRFRQLAAIKLLSPDTGQLQSFWLFLITFDIRPIEIACRYNNVLLTLFGFQLHLTAAE